MKYLCLVLALIAVGGCGGERVVEVPVGKYLNPNFVDTVYVDVKPRYRHFEQGEYMVRAMNDLVDMMEYTVDRIDAVEARLDSMEVE